MKQIYKLAAIAVFLLVENYSAQCPAPSVSVSSTMICQGESIALSASSTTDITKWYTAASGGSFVGSSTSGAPLILTPPSTSTYYAETTYSGILTYTSSHLFTVPAGVTQLTVDCRGGAGGSYLQGLGGKGGRVQAVMPVIPSQLLFIDVGMAGNTTGIPFFTVGGGGSAPPPDHFGGPGAGSGGGSSGIRTSPYGLSDRLIVAGGGGGGCYLGGVYGLTGGDGGGLIAADGMASTDQGCYNLIAPTGGTQFAGGSGGTNSCSWNGGNGSLGNGGNAYGTYGSAGGGGGYYGGGGGSNNMSGAGGSSFTHSLATFVVHTAGYQSGGGLVILSYTCNSVSRTPITVTVNPTPTVAVNSGSVCSGSSFVIIPSGANGYTINANSFTVSPVATTVYSIIGIDSNSCISTGVSTVAVKITPTLAVNSPIICSGNSVVITPVGALNYSISGNNFIVSPGTTTSYSISGESNGCAAINTVVSTVSVNITPTISADSATICSGTPFTITPTGAAAYSISGNNFVVLPGVTTSYSVTGVANNGCIGNTVVSTVSVNITPTLSVNSATICSGSSVALIPSGAGSGATYSITGGSFNISPSSTTVYSIAGTGTNGCTSASVAVTVSVNITPTLSVNSGTICSGSQFTITPSGNAAGTYTLTGGAYTVAPASTAFYTLTGTGPGNCPSANSVVSTVSVNITPTVTAADFTICSGNSVAIAPLGAMNYSITGNAFTVSPINTSTYAIIGESNSCASANTAVSTVSVNTTPTVTAGSVTVCSGAAVTISPAGAVNYSITGGTFIVSPVNTSTYAITGESHGCYSENAEVVTVWVDPTPTVTISNATICSGTAATLLPSGAATYTITGGSFTVSPLQTTSYSLSGTSAEGCLSLPAVALVSVNPTPTVSVSSGSICAGQSFSLNAAGADLYTYYNGAAPVVTPTANASYSVTGTTLAGCTSAVFAVSGVTVVALPQPLISAFAATLCAGEDVVLNASGAASYTWQTGITAPSITVHALLTESFSLMAESNGCTNAAAFVLNISDCTRLGSQTQNLSLTAYPNPTGGALLIAGLQRGVWLRLYNALGALLMEEQAADGQHQMDLSALPPGIYTLSAAISAHLAANIKVIRQ